jgi:hypothetical protein
MVRGAEAQAAPKEQQRRGQLCKVGVSGAGARQRCIHTAAPTHAVGTVPVHGAELPADGGVHPDGIFPELEHLGSHGCSTSANTHRGQGGSAVWGHAWVIQGGSNKHQASTPRGHTGHVSATAAHLPSCNRCCCTPTWAGFDEHPLPPRCLLQPAGIAVRCSVHRPHLQIEAVDLVVKQI